MLRLLYLVAFPVLFGRMDVLDTEAGRRAGLRIWKAMKQGCERAESDLVAEKNQVARRRVEITNVLGLHLRVAGRFVKCASRFQSEIRVFCKDLVADGKSILDLLSLAAVCGTTLVVEANGTDAEQAVAALVELISSSSQDSGDQGEEIGSGRRNSPSAQGAIAEGNASETPARQNVDHSPKGGPRWDSWRLGSTNGSKTDRRGAVRGRWHRRGSHSEG